MFSEQYFYKNVIRNQFLILQKNRVIMYGDNNDYEKHFLSFYEREEEISRIHFGELFMLETQLDFKTNNIILSNGKNEILLFDEFGNLKYSKNQGGQIQGIFENGYLFSSNYIKNIFTENIVQFESNIGYT
jgi:hypothetical protein